MLCETIDDLFPRIPEYMEHMEHPPTTQSHRAPSGGVSGSEQDSCLNSLKPILVPLMGGLLRTNQYRELDINPHADIAQDHLDIILRRAPRTRQFVWHTNREVSYVTTMMIVSAIHQTWPLALPLFPALEKLDFDDHDEKWLLFSGLLFGPAISELRTRLVKNAEFNRVFLESIMPNLRSAMLKRLDLVFDDDMDCPLDSSHVHPSPAAGVSGEPHCGDADWMLEHLPHLEYIAFPFLIGARGLAALSRLRNLVTANVRFRDEDIEIDEEHFPNVIESGFKQLERLVVHLRWNEGLLNTNQLLSKLHPRKLRAFSLIVRQPAASGWFISSTALDSVVWTVTHSSWASSVETLEITATPPAATDIPLPPLLDLAGGYVSSMQNLRCLKFPLDAVRMRGHELLIAVDSVTRDLGYLKDLDLLPARPVCSQPLLPFYALHVLSRNCRMLERLAVDVSGIMRYDEQTTSEAFCWGGTCRAKSLKVGCGCIEDPYPMAMYIRKHFPFIRDVSSSWELLADNTKDVGWDCVNNIIKESSSLEA